MTMRKARSAISWHIVRVTIIVIIEYRNAPLGYLAIKYLMSLGE